MGKRRHTIVSLFSGAMGLDLGLEQAGFEVCVAVENNSFAAETIRKNRPDLPLFQKDLKYVRTKRLLKEAGLEPGDVTIVTGGPSCQTFSTAGLRGSLGDPKGRLFKQFLRVVRETRPRFFVMENVRGVLSAAVKHRKLLERGPGYRRLTAKEELGSAFTQILQALKELNYYVVFNIVNAADYGVPQARERVLFIGSRDGEEIFMPEPTHTKEAGNSLPRWRTLREALDGLKDPKPAYTQLPPSKQRYLKMVKNPGENWRNLPKEVQAEALGGAFKSWGGRVGFFRRLRWDQPAPALTTRPDSKATMLGHPEKDRILSVREYARIQQFPDTWEFAGGIPQLYKQLGNAVPLGLGEAIGKAIKKSMACRRKKHPERLGLIVCADSALLDRLANRPRTILNPDRMRLVSGADAMRKWLNGSRRNRQGILDYVVSYADATIAGKRTPAKG